MGPSEPKHRAVFKRMETDREFVDRLRVVFDQRGMSDWGALKYKAAADLDEYAWDAVKMQRRIVEDVS